MRCLKNEHYPIFHLSYQELKELANSIEIKRNPYEKRYREFIYGEKGEVLFGCILCPYKSEGFYKQLQKEYSEVYYFARLLMLLASAKNLITEGREYYYFQSSRIM